MRDRLIQGNDESKKQKKKQQLSTVQESMFKLILNTGLT